MQKERDHHRAVRAPPGSGPRPAGSHVPVTSKVSPGRQLLSFFGGRHVPSVAAQLARDKHKSSASSSQGAHRDGKNSLSATGHRRFSRPHQGRDDGPHHRRQPTQVQVQHIDISLQDLDYHRTTFLLRVKPACTASTLKKHLRSQYMKTSRRIPEEAEVRFYNQGGKALCDDEPVADERGIWYRVAMRPNQLETWKFTHDQDETHGRLDSDLTNQLIRAIECGATFGDLRSRIASYVKITDANRVMLWQKNGLRPTLMRGNSWEVAQVKKKRLCNWLSIDIAPKNYFVVLRGLGRDYVYHPFPYEPTMRSTNMKELKQWMEHCLFKATVGEDQKQFHLKWKHIALSQSGNLARENSIVWGGLYEFELPTDAAELFSIAEADLLPASESCIVCGDDKKLSDFPVRITAVCKHKPNLCKECLGHWIQSGLDTYEWDKIKCPDCPELLKFEDVRRYAPEDVFSRYDRLATRATVKNIKNFHWCLSTKCESGQIHDTSCGPKFKCMACSSRHCVKHNVPWHSQETCEAYDKRNKQRRKEEKASEATVKKITKKCPKCDRDVHKFTGCNHITCICRHEWCYLCFAPYQRTDQNFLYCKHNPSCTEENLLDLIDEGFIRPEGRQPFLRPIIPGPGQFFGQRRGPGRFPPPPPPAVRPRQANPGNRPFVHEGLPPGPQPNDARPPQPGVFRRAGEFVGVGGQPPDWLDLEGVRPWPWRNRNADGDIPVHVDPVPEVPRARNPRRPAPSAAPPDGREMPPPVNDRFPPHGRGEPNEPHLNADLELFQGLLEELAMNRGPPPRLEALRTRIRERAERINMNRRRHRVT